MNRWLMAVMVFMRLTLPRCSNDDVSGEKPQKVWIEINTVIGNPTPKDFLGNAEADIFVLDDIVYSNMQDVDWVQVLYYMVGEQVAEMVAIHFIRSKGHHYHLGIRFRL
ncbi:hypothetical protein [Sporosarcina sp. YIM B06819]|uniref:hypothetical protein n=1 Tax=Sporosarcina sp. YIM B06819 TaxID=3081769 RepID=UPI00298D5E01|nr:hypothetical protein [Sporosarcina sp. YIM B06819]